MSSSSLSQLALKILDAQVPWATGIPFKTSSPESQARKLALSEFSEQLENALEGTQVKSEFGRFRCDFSKGMGVDTSSPWVRVFSDRNPKPTIGWATVIFGAEDGNSIAIAASIAISSGANVRAVSNMLGHTDPSVTLRIYTHLFNDDQETLANAIGEKFAKSA